MFNLIYDSTGLIVSYQEGPEAIPASQIPIGCGLLTYATTPPIFNVGRITHRIDVATKKLVQLDEMPAPISEADGNLTVS